ncbi:MAG: serine/threonine protein kinase, partial [Acidobacteriota bacterium]|nr:serine/threonine protein kinase [Acidobacteriota bacterium]
MKAEDWGQLKNLFHAAIELNAGDRAAFLNEACAGDDDLRRRIKALLASHEQAGAFLISPALVEAGVITAEEQERSDEEQAAPLAGRRIGNYEITREIGRGGMGTVYLAVRADDHYRQQVAIKLVNRGMDTDVILRRFVMERQILADLEHTNIARLLDGGATTDGLPYFVMEYIEGQPITQYCDERRLPIAARLGLFREVCAAVQYAHQHLVVHRDIKPGNILVAEDGAPKLLDFGIAKLLTSDTGQAATRTLTGLRMMTPDYASPEQVRGGAITTASDIYSLGTVLYELLTGRRAHQFKTYSPVEIEETICLVEAEKPSEAAARTTGAPSRWRKQLAGDVDNIVLMALRKEPERRYQSVEQFSEDIRRHLEGLPVIARKDTLGYRTGKFARRHKLGIAAVTLVIASLMGGLIAASYQARRAERRFGQVRKLANTFLFDFHDKIKNLPGSTEAREMVVKTALEYLDSLAAEAGGDAALQLELAQAYQKVGDVQGDPWSPNLGHPDEAMKSYQKASALAEKLAANNKDDLKIQRELARNYFKIGTLRAETGDKENSYGLLRQSIALSEQVARRSGERIDGAYLCDSYVRLGDVYLDTGDARSGLEFYRKSLEVSRQWAQKLKDDRTLSSLATDYSHVGEALTSIGDLVNAIENYRQTLLIGEEVAQRNPNNAYYKRSLQLNNNWLGNLYGNPRFVNAGDTAAAIKHYRQSLAIAEEIAAADPKSASARMDLITSCNALGDLLAETSPAESAEYYRRALAVIEPLRAGAPNELRFLRRQSYSLGGIAVPLRKLGEREAALQYLHQSLQITRQLSTHYPANPQVQSSLHAGLLALANALTDAFTEAGDHAAPLGHYREALAVAEASAAAARSDVYARWRLADSYAGLGKLREAMAAAAKSSVDQRRHHRNEACSWRRKSLAIWDGWT